jgi:hypothetical protein
MIDHKTTDGIAAGDAAYLRLRVIGFVDDIQGRSAVCQSIDRKGKVVGETCYYVPVAEVIRADVVTKEVRGE